MATPTQAVQTPPQAQQLQIAGGQSASSLSFDWTMIALSCWFMAGLFLDGWAHAHIPQLETFFTPWHAVLYSGYLSVALFLSLSALRNHRRGYSWARSPPSGYELSLLGAGIFAVSGVGDMIWHILFGIEQNVEALLSPTHLGLATGLILIESGPLRAAFRRPPEQTRGWKALLPMLASVTFIYAVFSFFTEYANPFIRLTASFIYSPQYHAINTSISLGLISILFQAALMTALVLLVIRRFTLPFGGLAADLLYRIIRPSLKRPDMLHLFAFAMPAVYYLCYFLNMAIFQGIQWSIHLWLGSVFMAGIVGLLLSYLVVPMKGGEGKAVQEKE